ncbi:MAG TPA: HD domain-containing phosphohydrolase [Rectinemataceae bacterium]|nr:HD domain-containing phosphohydrolase [Rectinemataceae bacterium]
MNIDPALKKARILIVDDEVANIKLLARMLETEGYTNLVQIQDSRKVLDEYHKARTNLILLDLRMPHLTGYEVMAGLKALDDPLMPPVVVLTAEKGRQALLQAFESGARDYLTKPFEMDELLARVRNMLEVNRAQLLLYQQREMLDAMVRARTEELLRTRMQVIEKLVRASEYRDNETGRHIIRVGRTASLLACQAGMGAQLCEDMLHAAPMHDVGKIGIPDAILLKKARLDPAEFEIMKRHTHIGAQLLETQEDHGILRMAGEIAYSHHEKWDGSGYPEGLEGENIPKSGRIVALCDVFDALTSVRPYKPAWTVDAALEYIHQNRGRHFDPGIVDLFDKHLSEVIAIRDLQPDEVE